MFTTERLRLYPFHAYDLNDLLHLWNDPRVQADLTHEYIVPRGSKFTETITDMAHSSLFYAVIRLKDTGAFMGCCHILSSNPKNRDGTLAFALLPDYRNMGYGTEVTRFLVDYSFRSLALHRVSLRLFERNIAGIPWFTKM